MNVNKKVTLIRLLLISYPIFIGFSSIVTQEFIIARDEGNCMLHQKKQFLNCSPVAFIFASFQLSQRNEFKKIKWLYIIALTAHLSKS